MTSKLDNEHDRLVLMLNQLMDERETLSRENEYLKAKLNQSVLVETIHEMKTERDVLLKLLSNLTTNQKTKDEQVRYNKHYIKENHSDHPLGAYNHCSTKIKSSTLARNNPLRMHRLKTHIEQPTLINCTETTPRRISSPASYHIKSSKKIFVSKPPTIDQMQEFLPRSFRKHDAQLKHSHNSPFQHYRSQSLQDLT